mgnify:CR=1 FL=1|jgi:hypothetical protein
MKGTTGKRIRRKSAYSLLDEQLKRGTKPEKINGKTTAKMIPLSEADKKRISTEMEKLSKKSF